MKLTGVLHMHSTHSYDGSVPLAELKELLKNRGVTFACMTEHTDNLDSERVQDAVDECKRLSDKSFLFIPGFEVPYKQTHVLMLGATHFISQKADASQLRAWADEAKFVILAHPQRNRFIVDDALLSVINGLEVWNQQYDGKKVPRLHSLILLRTLRETKCELLATGGVDLHRREHIGMPVVSVECDALTEEAIFQGLKAGAYTFGGSQSVPAMGEWEKGKMFSYQMTSILSTSVIFWDAFFALFGIKLPKGLRQAIRSNL